VPSVKRDRQLVLLAMAGVFAAVSLGGCSTTQEKAAAHRAESERILEAREKRQQAKQHERKHEKEKG
jgi:alpha-D-ribose 1-methylphosphonate 5-triphosphate diphosphatase PhnM